MTNSWHAIRIAVCTCAHVPRSEARLGWLQECGIEVDEEQYAAGFTANLMNSLHAWASGATFAEVTSKTSIYEGTLIRCARRLMELMNQIIYAADKVGEHEMKQRVEAALACLQRGIMFTSSLYLAGS